MNFAEYESMEIAAPSKECAAHGRRPFQLKIPYETGPHFERLLGFHLNLNYSSRLIDWHKKSFAYRKNVSRIHQRRRFETRNNRSKQRLCRNFATFGQHSQPQAAQNLQRINPRFHFSGFVSQKARPLSYRRKKFPRPPRARYF